jgi:hypothetical protein
VAQPFGQADALRPAASARGLPQTLDAMSTLARLQAWYSAQCNGEWEHASGVSVESTDNPGWWVKIHVLGTSLSGRQFTELAENVDANRFALGPHWLSCRLEGDTWHGAGDETQLERVLVEFLSWAEANATVQQKS